jgi:hypothetical protein
MLEIPFLTGPNVSYRMHTCSRTLLHLAQGVSSTFLYTFPMRVGPLLWYLLLAFNPMSVIRPESSKMEQMATLF